MERVDPVTVTMALIAN